MKKKKCPHCHKPLLVHGTRTMYQYGCRCKKCANSASIFQAKAYKKRKKDLAKWHKKFSKAIDDEIYPNEEAVPNSKNKLFDNSEEWLDDEPWRKW